jgi:hypothetical protein
MHENLRSRVWEGSQDYIQEAFSVSELERWVMGDNKGT